MAYNHFYRRPLKTYYRRAYRSYGGYKKKFNNYYATKKRVWRGKLASYQKGRLKGILWGFLFAFLLIPALVYVVKNRQSIVATFKNIGGNK